MATVNDIERVYREQLLTLGKSALHNAFPNDFEFYFCAFELVDSSNNVIDYFGFPIMPQQISQDEPQLNQVKKSRRGVSIYQTTSFIPIPITLAGNFGRRFKFLLGDVFVDAAAVVLSAGSGNYGQFKSRTGVFSPQIKTGYGCIKILQAIVNKSRQLDEKGKLPKLFFYNPSFGESFEVVIDNIRFDANEGQSNLIWSYNLTMRAVAPIEQESFEDDDLTYDSLNRDFLQDANNYASGGYFLQ